jgi:glycine dehydrogenase subunit 1
LMGPVGLRNIALACYHNTQWLSEKLAGLNSVKILFHSPSFHEMVLQLNVNADAVLEELAKFDIQGGFSLQKAYPELGNSILVCVTETKAGLDLDEYVDKLKFVLSRVTDTGLSQQTQKKTLVD